MSVLQDTNNQAKINNSTKRVRIKQLVQDICWLVKFPKQQHTKTNKTIDRSFQD